MREYLLYVSSFSFKYWLIFRRDCLKFSESLFKFVDDSGEESLREVQKAFFNQILRKMSGETAGVISG